MFVGSYSAIPIHTASNNSATKNDSSLQQGMKADFKPQTINSNTIPSNCSVTNISKSSDQRQPASNHNQLSGITYKYSPRFFLGTQALSRIDFYSMEINCISIIGLSVSKTTYGPEVHLTISKTSEPAVHLQKQLQIFTTSAPHGHATEQAASIRSSNPQPPVSVTLVNASGTTGQAHGGKVHLRVSSDSSYQAQVQDSHANDVPLNLSTTPPQTPAGMSSSVTITASPAKRCRLLTG